MTDDRTRQARSSPEALTDFWNIYDRFYDAIQAETLLIAQDHPEFGPLVRATPPEQARAQAAESREKLRRAFSGEWDEYYADLRRQGAQFAGMGLSFRGWYDITRAFIRGLTPRLVAELGSEPDRLSAALMAMHDFVDRAMATIAESYLDAKEEALRRWERVFTHAGWGVVIRSQDGLRHDAVNSAYAEMHGYSAEEVLRLGTLDVVAPQERERARAALEMVGERGSHTWETVHVRKDGSAFPVLTTATAVKDEHGRVVYRAANIQDITDRKRAEELRAKSIELEAESKRAREASRLKSEFLANMSHELRTPLNSIIGFAELLHDGQVGPVEARQREFLGDILTSGHHLLQLINDVLDLSKVEAGRMDFRPEPVEPARVVAEVVGVLRATSQSKGLAVDVEIDPAVGQLVLDPARLKQVLYNYLSNALKFTPSGGQVTVRVRPGGPDTVRFEVQDTGPGIPLAEQGKLFVEFQQLDAGAAKKHGGTGLGLALTRRLVEAQGGSVGLASEPGKGSTFHALLPRRTSGKSPVVGGERFAAAKGAPTVLVVEDDPADQKLLVRVLRDEGFAVETVATGEAAIARCAEQRFDAITLDLLLPDMDGLSVLSRVRLAAPNATTPVIVVSVVAERGAVAGFAVHDVLPKPLDPGRLLASLRRAGVEPLRAESVLVVDDDEGSLKLMETTLGQLGYRASCHLTATSALASARAARPLAVVLDLVMPEMDGFEFLENFRAEEANRAVPVIVWTMKDLTREERERLARSAQAVVSKKTGGTRPLLSELRGLVPRETS